MSGMWEDRHPATQQMMKWFDYQHLPEHLKLVSSVFYDAAARVVSQVADGPELTTALRKLVEAKDCAVRARIDTPPGWVAK